MCRVRNTGAGIYGYICMVEDGRRKMEAGSRKRNELEMKCMYRNSLGVLTVLFMGLWVSSCGVYSFTGASIPPEAKTVSVLYFPNKAPLVEPTLSPLFTDGLRDKFIRQTNLEMIDRNGDLAIEGEITEYKTDPVAIQGDQTAAMNRLTITINVRFVNKFEPDKDFETQFTQFKDYDSSEDLNAIKTDLLDELVDILSDDVFNKAVVNW